MCIYLQYKRYYNFLPKTELDSNFRLHKIYTSYIFQNFWYNTMVQSKLCQISSLTLTHTNYKITKFINKHAYINEKQFYIYNMLNYRQIAVSIWPSLNNIRN